MKRLFIILAAFFSSTSYAQDAVRAEAGSQDLPQANRNEVVCTMEYMPHKCAINYGQQLFEGEGNNRCMAYNNLLIKIHSQEWFMDPVFDPEFKKNLKCEPAGM